MVSLGQKYTANTYMKNIDKTLMSFLFRVIVHLKVKTSFIFLTTERETWKSLIRQVTGELYYGEVNLESKTTYYNL